MQQVEISEVHDGAAAISANVLRALGISNGDRIAFVKQDHGSISLVKAPVRPATKRPMSEIVGMFSTGEQRLLEEDLALLHEIR